RGLAGTLQPIGMGSLLRALVGFVIKLPGRDRRAISVCEHGIDRLRPMPMVRKGSIEVSDRGGYWPLDDACHCFGMSELADVRHGYLLRSRALWPSHRRAVAPEYGGFVDQSLGASSLQVANATRAYVRR